jgi:hypothetical protein
MVEVEVPRQSQESLYIDLGNSSRANIVGAPYNFVLARKLWVEMVQSYSLWNSEELARNPLGLPGKGDLHSSSPSWHSS